MPSGRGPTNVRLIRRTLGLLLVTVVLLVVGFNLLFTTLALVAVLVLFPAAFVTGWSAFTLAARVPVERTDVES